MFRHRPRYALARWRKGPDGDSPEITKQGRDGIH